jgi:predicted acyltransferase
LDQPARLVSLDAFRGITIAAMLVVNNPGSWSAIYPPLRHAEWHGWTPTDLIFPFFLFIVGVAIAFSLGGRLGRGDSRRQLMLKATMRAAILFALGLLLHGFPGYDLSSIRVMGVLQRIAVAYFAASAIVIGTWKSAEATGWKPQAIWTGALLVGYWLLMTLVPVQGSGAGVLEPGRDLGAYLDRTIFGTQHLWAQSKTWDPEGLLSTLPAIATVLTGVLTGHWIRTGASARGAAVRQSRARGDPEILVGLFLAANAGLFAGWAWSAFFPINKSLWTSSYVLFTSGFAIHVLAMCYWLIDVRRWRAWATPFVVFGMNAIAAFWLSSLGARILGLVRIGAAGDEVALKTWLLERLFAPWLPPVDASLAFALSYTLFWLAAMWLLYRQRIFIKV